MFPRAVSEIIDCGATTARNPKDRSCVLVLASLLPCTEMSELTVAKRNTTGAGLNLLSTLFQIAPKSAIHAAARGENRRRQTWGAGERAWGCGWLCTLATLVRELQDGRDRNHSLSRSGSGSLQRIDYHRRFNDR